MGLVRCQVKIGAAITGIKKLENRAKPAAIDAAELDSPTVECIHPNRNPHTGPSPLRKYAYCPPASGNAAPNSANESAPNSDSNPPTIHAPYTTLTDPPTAAISPGFKKIPVPTIVPITMAAAAHGPSARIRSTRSLFSAKIPIKVLPHNPRKLPWHDARNVSRTARQFAGNRTDRKSNDRPSQHIPSPSERRKPIHRDHRHKPRRESHQRSRFIRARVPSPEQKHTE